MTLIRRAGAGILWWLAHIFGFSLAIAISTTFAAGVGGGVAVLVGQIFSFDLSRRIGTVIGTGLSGLFFGACLGGIQALLLRRRLVSLTRWALASTAGWGLGFFIPALLTNLFNLERTLLWIAVSGGITTFCASMVLVFLLRSSARYGLTWVVLSTLGGALGSIAAGMSSIGSGDVMAIVMGSWAVEGAIYSILIGFAPPPPKAAPLMVPTGSREPTWAAQATSLYWWTFANMVGPFAGLLVSIPAAGAIAALTLLVIPRVNDSLDAVAWAGLFGLLALVASTGAIVGWAQWLILRANPQQARQWIPLTALGWVIGWPLATLLSEIYPANSIVSGSVLGLSIGGAQWLLLRRRRSEAAWWPLISVIALCLGTAAANLYNSQDMLGQNVALVGALVQLFAIYSFCTGLALLCLRRLPNAAGKHSLAARRRMFWLRWVLIGSAGWWLGTILGRSGVAAYAETPLFWPPLGILLHALLASASLGLLQLLAFRGTDAPRWRWLLTSVAGWMLGYYLASVANDLLPPRLGGQPDPVFAAAIFGLSLGLAQWLALYRTATDSAWWIPISVTAWSLSTLIDTACQEAIGFGPGIGTTGAVITGAALAWLLIRGGEAGPPQAIDDKGATP